MNPDAASYVLILKSAHERFEQGSLNEAIILAQTAAELCGEAAIDRACEARGISDLRPVLGRLLYSNFNLAHDRVASLYVALTGDDIKQASFWSQYKQHNELRNDIVHDGRQATREQAETSLGVIGEMVGHIDALN